MSVPLEYTVTTVAEIDQIYDRLQATYRDGKTLPLEYRRKQLLQLARLAQDNVAAIEEATFKDLRKPRQEAATAEAVVIIRASLEAVDHLEEWAAPEKPKVEEWRHSWDTTVYPVPKGVALIISPWNYPFNLTFNPLVGAIAAGCPTVLKPSEYSPNSSALIAQLVAKYLDPEAYVVVNGAVPETAALLHHRWDHIFFTGGGKIGKIVASAAAQHLTPVTLELGGQSPVIVDEDCDLDLTAKRIMWAKSQNSGQLCLTVNHVLVLRSVASAFEEALKKVYTTFWPKSPFHPDMKWGKIINPVHHARVKDLLDRTQGTVILGGDIEGDQMIAPTVVSDVQPQDSLMEEEIFGPILPIIEVENVDEAIQYISQQPSPLAIYAFTNSDELKEKLLKKTRSGSIVFNDVYSQARVYELPFGGFGESGYGTYYSKASFDAFTHRRGFLNILPSSESLPFFSARYRPYTDESYNALTGLLHAKIPDA